MVFNDTGVTVIEMDNERGFNANRSKIKKEKIGTVRKRV